MFGYGKARGMRRRSKATRNHNNWQVKITDEKMWRKFVHDQILNETF